jgi:hypothetical protein
MVSDKNKFRIFAYSGHKKYINNFAGDYTNSNSRNVLVQSGQGETIQWSIHVLLNINKQCNKPD